MLRPLTSNLVLATTQIDVSQAVPMGKNTGANVNVALHNATSGTIGLSVKLQGSNDLDYWEDVTGYSTSLTVAPDNDTFPVVSPAAISCAFVRLRYANTGSQTVIFSADINLVEL